MNLYRCLCALAATLSLAASLQASPAENITNRLARIVDGSNYTFSIIFGPQGALQIDGYQQATNCAFMVRKDGKELFRQAAGRLFFPSSSGTGGAVAVHIPYSFHIVTGLNGIRNATLGISLMPPTRRPPMILHTYEGLASRTADLPETGALASGWRYAETNQTGTSIEIGPRDDKDRVVISLQKLEEDRQSIFLHELSVSSGTPAKAIETVAAPREVEVTDFGVGLTFMRNISVATLNAVTVPSPTNDLAGTYGRHIDRCAKGLEGVFPSLPPGLKKLPALPPVP